MLAGLAQDADDRAGAELVGGGEVEVASQAQRTVQGIVAEAERDRAHGVDDEVGARQLRAADPGGAGQGGELLTVGGRDVLGQAGEAAAIPLRDNDGMEEMPDAGGEDMAGLVADGGRRPAELGQGEAADDDAAAVLPDGRILHAQQLAPGEGTQRSDQTMSAGGPLTQSGG